MRLTPRLAALLTAPLLALPVVAQAGSGDAPLPGTLDPWLAARLAQVSPAATLRVGVQADSPAAAVRAVEAAGLRVQQRWPLINAAVAVGPADRVDDLGRQPGVRFVQGDRPLAMQLSTAHKATRSDIARSRIRTPSGGLLDGSGVTIAIIDSGVDGTHPFLQQNGATKVVQNRKNVCGIEINPSLSEGCFVSLPDTDTPSAGGHGTHVAGIAAGVPVTATDTLDGTKLNLRGSAPGAKVVMLSVGAGPLLLDAAAAQYWVLEHQQNPCRPANQQSRTQVDPACPPIRVTNHSYGPASGSTPQTFDPRALDVQLQRALVAKGVVAVWAAGNNGGAGREARTNPPGMDPTGGILSVANYDDGNTGRRDRVLDPSSSRGRRGFPDTYPDLAAPGTNITSSCRPYLPICSSGLSVIDAGNYNVISGTSMAAPYVAGVVAQLFQADPRLTPAKVEQLLERYAYRFGDEYEPDPTNRYSPTSFDAGHGLVDVYATLRAVCATDSARC